MKTWLFEGEQRTFPEIRAMVPALSESTVRVRLRAGDKSRVDMLARPVPKVIARDGSLVQYSLRARR